MKATDPDVLIILLGNMHKFSEIQIWLSNSASKRGTQKDQNYVNCTRHVSKIEATVYIDLPAFHAFIDCNYTAAFYNKDKVKPFKMFASNDKFSIVLKAFGRFRRPIRRKEESTLSKSLLQLLGTA